MNKYDIILDVCITHNISKTASRLNYSPSSISQTIKTFEKEIGVPLFNRSKQGMKLLPNTEEIIESMRVICEEEQKIRQTAMNLTSLDSGYIRLGAIQSISYHWLPLILKKFSEQYPNIRFEMIVGGFGELKEKLISGELEGIFVSEYAVPGMPFLPLGEDELMLVVPQNHPLSEKKEVDIQELAEYEFILSSDGLDYETGHIFEENCITPDIRYQINEDYAVCKMVEQGFGVTILPQLLLHRIPFDVCILPFSEHYSRTLGIAYCGSKQPTLATLRFLEYIREESKHIIKENFR